MTNPSGYGIEDEALKISPKFAGQALIPARPAPAPQKLASPQARKIQEALESPVKDYVEPQPLRDALESIGEQYQITITIDPAVAATGNVRPSDVGFRQTDIRLKSLLAILLEQSPQRLAFKIEGNALKIYPKAAPP